MERIYFDNGSTSFPKAPGVAEAMSRYLLEQGVNVGRSSYGASMDVAIPCIRRTDALTDTTSAVSCGRIPSSSIFPPINPSSASAIQGMHFSKDWKYCTTVCTQIHPAIGISA